MGRASNRATAPPATAQQAQLGAAPEGLVGLRDFWLISDTHFCHSSIAEHADRPADHERRIIGLWQQMIGDDDPVLHLGDIALGRAEPIAAALAQLPGRIHMVRGNHDRRSASFYRRCGITVVERPFALRVGGWLLVFSHRPLPGLLRGGRVANIHGHIHRRVLDDPRMVNVCVEQTGYAPVRLREVLCELARRGR